VAASLDAIRQVAHRFLHDWRQKFLYVGRQQQEECEENVEGK